MSPEIPRAAPPIAQPRGTSPRKLLAQAIALIIVIALICVSFYGSRKPDAQDQDFGAYYRAGQAVLAGHSPYDLGTHGFMGAYMYAPVFAHFVFRFFALLPYVWAVRVFMAINVIATIACVRICLRLFAAPNRDPFALALLALIPTGTYLWADLHNGQVGTLVLLACLVWLTLTLAKRPFWGGMVLAIAVGLKLYPVLLLVYLVIRRDWRGLAGVGTGLLILFLAPGFFVGFSELIPIHQAWLHLCAISQIPTQTVRTGNQSLLGVIARLPWFSNGNQTLWNDGPLAALVRVYPAIVLIVTALLYGAILLGRYRRQRWTAALVLIEFSLLLLWMTIGTPRAWTFNFATEMVPAFLVAGAILDRRPHAWVGVIALLGVLLAVMLPSNLMQHGTHWSLIAYIVQNKHFNAALLLGISVLAMSAPGRASDTESATQETPVDADAIQPVT